MKGHIIIKEGVQCCIICEKYLNEEEMGESDWKKKIVKE